MANKKTTVRAVYSQGVFKPLDPLDLPENSTVEIIVDSLGLKRRLKDLFASLHDRNKSSTAEEIEQDVARVIREVRGGN